MPADLRKALHDAAPRRIPDLDFDGLWRRHRRRRAMRITSGVAAATAVAVALFGLVDRIVDDPRPMPAQPPVTSLPSQPEDWERVELPPGSRVESIVAGGPGLVAVGTTPEAAAAWASPDGETWELSDAPSTPGGLADVAHTPAGLIAVGFGDGGTGRIWISADGVTWDQRENDAVFEDASLQAVVAGGPGVVVAGMRPEGPQVWYSADSVSWHAAAVPALPDGYDSAPQGVETFIDDLAVVGDRLVVVGHFMGGKDEQFMWTSVDGLRWDEVPYDEAVFSIDSSVAGLTDGPGGGVVSR